MDSIKFPDISQNLQDNIRETCLYFCIWFMFYFLIHFLIPLKGKKLEILDIKNRMVSMGHGFLTSLFSTSFILYYGFDMDMIPNAISFKITCFTLGYFTYDLCACLIFGLADLKLIVHHLFVLVIFVTLLITEKGTFVAIIGLVLAESTNFSMHFRGIFKNFGLRHTLLYEIADNFYMFLYILLRGFFAPYVCAMSYFSKTIHIVIPVMFVGILIQSFGFIRIMISMLKKNLQNKRERDKKRIYLYWWTVNPATSQLDYVKLKKPNSTIF